MPPTFYFSRPSGSRGMNIDAQVSYDIIFSISVEGLGADFSLIDTLKIAANPWKHETDGTITVQ